MSSPPQPKKRRRDTKLYSEDWVIGEEEDIEGKHTFNLQEKLESVKFNRDFVTEMEGKDFTISYLQKNGFETPILIKEKSDLGLLVPNKIFSVNDVKICVGSRRQIDVMDVNTQKNIVMTMKEWQKYFDDPIRDSLLNVLSLEFSHTKLDNYVQSPMIVRQIDWVDTVWPRHLKEAQTESTNAIEDMMYPKVQKYCLMSVKGCYTDFHIDFGGTSVWYHILKGSKIFWLIPPTDENIALYEKWVLSGQQGDVFFGDTVEWCGRVTLAEGSTFFIPSGWIHAVYTPSDSMVFGGNFLHSYCISTQLRIAQVEETTHVPQKFRYPFFTEMLWYVLERYVHCLLGTSHLKDTPSSPAKEHVHLTFQELRGIKAILSYLHFLPASKKNVPELIEDPVALIKDVRMLVERHRNDNPASAVTGSAIFNATETCKVKRKMVKAKRVPKPKQEGKLVVSNYKMAAPKRRRTRCKKCVACSNSDCGQCNFCKDMIKYGGTGKSKQSCIQRQCLQPMLPVKTTCILCGKDGWENDPTRTDSETRESQPNSIMECAICYDLVHPACIASSYPDVPGIVDEDLPNSWECPKCCKEGRNANYKPRHFKARDKVSSLRESGIFTNGSEELEEAVEKGTKRQDDSQFDISRCTTNFINHSDLALPPFGEPEKLSDFIVGPDGRKLRIDFDHGTTTLGFMYQGGIVLAVDSRATGGSYIASQSMKKVVEINDFLLGTIAGGAADCVYWDRVLTKQCRMYELRNRERISVAAASKLMTNMIYNYKGMGLSIGMMIAGWDKRGPGLYYVDSEGTRTPGKVFSAGSGSPYAYGVLDSGYRWDLTDDEAYELGRRSIYHATFRDCSSGGIIRVYHMKSTGWVHISDEDCKELHYAYAEKK